MTVEERVFEKEDEQKKKEKKTVLVGIRIDRNGRELLNWALVKVAEQGDHVIALHVCRNPDPGSTEKVSLDDYLEVYKGLCNVKQINLTGQVSHGNSVRRVLVREAKICGAMAIVVGVSRRQHALGSCLYVAKYCSKNLPSTTMVLAVYNGKVVFQRGLSNHPPGIKGDPRPSVYPIHLYSLKENNPSYEHSEAPEVEIQSPQEVQSTEDKEASSSISGSDDIKHDSVSLDQLFKEEVPSNFSSVTNKEVPESKLGWPLLDSVRLDQLFKEEVPSKLSSVTVTEVPESRLGWPLLDSARLDQLFKEEVPSKVSSVSIKEVPDSTPGWPLLRCATSLAQNNLQDSEARKMSVVQWVMSLPNRTTPLSTPTKIGLDSDKSENEFSSDSVDCENTILKNNLSAWGELPKEMEFLVRTTSSNCRWFSHKELNIATSQFSSENLIGKGGCSRVYKGFLSDGKPVAVKVLTVSKEAWKDFILEIDIISSLKHKNITPLLGVCIDNNDLILAYDFFSKGSLEENLHAGKEEKHGLSWEVRFKVAIGIAEAISYLHNECTRPVIHRDIKSSNVLLSEEFEPQLSDFGLAIWAPTSSAETHLDVVGTFGYLAPEYFMYGKVSDKIDVYSYGVLLLELLSGRKPISTETPKGQESLVMWAKPILENGDISGILDPDLIGKFDKVEMQRMVLAVTLCITRTARLRPEMNQIVKLLQGEKDIEEWVNSHVNDLKESDNEEGDEAYPDSSVESHLGLALLDVEDDTTSFSSVEQNNHHTLEDYLKGRWSRSSSFN
ncbi:Protein kinase domain [Macleaya cordata]|uniref:Protein kinase domain n=1 Tax=Macleaya cordata TaxID=56857 RepID=A0A200RA59_MACCD|nr:Protein kinase domain [Macleaya cordata]